MINNKKIYTVDNANEPLTTEDGFMLMLGESDLPETTPKESPAYMTIYQWITKDLPAGKQIFFTVAEKGVRFLGYETVADAIAGARIMADLHSQDIKTQKEALSTLIDKYAPSARENLISWASSQLGHVAINKLLIDNFVPFGLKIPASLMANKVIDSLLDTNKINNIIKDIFNTETLDQLITKGLTDGLVQGADLVEYMQVPIEVTKHSILDNAERYYEIGEEQDLSVKTISEIRQEYLKAQALSLIAKSTADQVRYILLNHVFNSDTQNIGGRISRLALVDLIARGIETTIKTKNSTAISSDIHIKNAEKIMKTFYPDEPPLNITSALKGEFAAFNEITQTEHAKIELVKQMTLVEEKENAGLMRSFIQNATQKATSLANRATNNTFDKDYPNLVKLREGYIKAYDKAEVISNKIKEIREQFVTGSQNNGSFDKFKEYRRAVCDLEFELNMLLKQLTATYVEYENSFQNADRLDQYLKRWSLPLGHLEACIAEDIKDIRASSIYVGFTREEATRLREEAIAQAALTTKKQQSYGEWFKNAAMQSIGSYFWTQPVEEAQAEAENEPLPKVKINMSKENNLLNNIISDYKNDDNELTEDELKEEFKLWLETKKSSKKFDEAEKVDYRRNM